MFVDGCMQMLDCVYLLCGRWDLDGFVYLVYRVWFYTFECVYVIGFYEWVYSDIFILDIVFCCSLLIYPYLLLYKEKSLR